MSGVGGAAIIGFFTKSCQKESIFMFFKSAEEPPLLTESASNWFFGLGRV